MNKKLNFISDKNLKSLKYKKLLLKKFINYPPKKCDVFIVLGGDGFMLKVLKEYYKFKKPFYGINTGTFGFLMNNLNLKNLSESLSKAKKISVFPLKMIAKNIKGKTKISLAINEVSLFRQSKQTTNLKIIKKSTIISKKFIGDGILVSTPAGSTAYNLSVYGPILSLNSRKIAVTPISPFRPRRWKGFTVKDNYLIKIINLDPKKRPVSVVADNTEFRNIKSVITKIDQSIRFSLLYDRKNSLSKKIKIEQIIKKNNTRTS